MDSNEGRNVFLLVGIVSSRFRIFGCQLGDNGNVWDLYGVFVMELDYQQEMLGIKAESKLNYIMNRVKLVDYSVIR